MFGVSVPINTVEVEGTKAVAVERVSGVSQTGFQVPIRRDFFEKQEYTNGVPRDHGVIGCADCDFASKFLSIFILLQNSIFMLQSNLKTLDPPYKTVLYMELNASRIII